MIAAQTANDLQLQHGRGRCRARSQWVIIRSGEPAKFTEIMPGTYSACVVPFPAEVQGMAAMGYVERHGDTLPAFCQR